MAKIDSPTITTYVSAKIVVDYTIGNNGSSFFAIDGTTISMKIGCCFIVLKITVINGNGNIICVNGTTITVTKIASPVILKITVININMGVAT